MVSAGAGWYSSASGSGSVTGSISGSFVVCDGCGLDRYEDSMEASSPASLLLIEEDVGCGCGCGG